MTMQTIDYKDFAKIELRVGTIMKVERFKKAQKPSYKLWIDLGKELGIKQSSAQITIIYNPEELIGKQVICVCNISTRQIADFMSEVLVTGFKDSEENIVLTTVERLVPNGMLLH